MKECTLQEAVELCKKNGGIFYLKDVMVPCKYKISPGGYIVSNYNGYVGKMEIWADAFTATWIYEPPKQSAFQKLSNGYPFLSTNKSVQEIARDFWNGAIEEVLNQKTDVILEMEMVSYLQDWTNSFLHKVRKLKEEE